MALTILYLIVILGELIFFMLFSAVIISFIFSSIMGSPYVPTKEGEFDRIFKKIKLKKNDTFYDLGCGDGRIVRMVAKKFGVKSVGIDVNPILIWYAKILSRLSGLSNCLFIRKNIFTINLRNVSIVYMFLMPELIQKFSPRLTKQLKKGVIVISHGFRIPYLQDNLYDVIEAKPFPTYFYRIGYNK